MKLFYVSTVLISLINCTHLQVELEILLHIYLQLISKLGSSTARSEEDAAIFFDAFQSTFDLLLEYVERSETDFLLETLVKSCTKAHRSLSSKDALKETPSTENANVEMADMSANAAPPEAQKLDRLMALISVMIGFKDGASVTPTQIGNLQNLFMQVG